MNKSFGVDDDRIAICPMTGCWLWMHNHGPYGHGQVRFQGVCTTAHRAFWITRHGSIPKRIHLDHIVCKTPACVNPDHLREVTPRVNALENTDSVVARKAQLVRCGKCGGEYSRGADGKRLCRPCKNRRSVERQRERYGSDAVYRANVLRKNKEAANARPS